MTKEYSNTIVYTIEWNESNLEHPYDSESMNNGCLTFISKETRDAFLTKHNIVNYGSWNEDLGWTEYEDIYQDGVLDFR